MDNLKMLLSTLFPVMVDWESMTMENTPEWTSMKHIELILLLEEHYNISIEADVIPLLISVEKIKEYLRVKNEQII